MSARSRSTPALIEPVVPFPALFAGGNQSRFGEHAEVLRYRRTGDRELRRKLGNGAFTRCQEL